MDFKSAPEVELINYAGTDLSIVMAARVSTLGDTDFTGSDEEAVGLINYLMKHRHGTPFEHNSITLRVSGPIFMFREWHRHRIQSYNEESGRYKQLDPVFHLPNQDRPLINVGTSARPVMGPATPVQWADQCERMERIYRLAYAAYEEALADGIAKEVAREVLPVGIFSTMYATANLRAWFNFLSLRVHDPLSTFVSYPQYEIQQAAEQVEEIIGQLFPIALAAFKNNGRVGP